MATAAKNTARPYRRSHCQRVPPSIGTSFFPRTNELAHIAPDMH